MASRSSESSARDGDKKDGRVLGRSAATGRFVLKPASKRGSITVREAKTAASSVATRKK
ncbi:MAG: hypothetical protein WBR13_03445 [Allosphingosinicella sp.]